MSMCTFTPRRICGHAYTHTNGCICVHLCAPHYACRQLWRAAVAGLERIPPCANCPNRRISANFYLARHMAARGVHACSCCALYIVTSGGFPPYSQRVGPQVVLPYLLYPEQRSSATPCCMGVARMKPTWVGTFRFSSGDSRHCFQTSSEFLVCRGPTSFHVTCLRLAGGRACAGVQCRVVFEDEGANVPAPVASVTRISSAANNLYHNLDAPTHFYTQPRRVNHLHTAQAQLTTCTTGPSAVHRVQTHLHNAQLPKRHMR